LEKEKDRSKLEKKRKIYIVLSRGRQTGAEVRKKKKISEGIEGECSTGGRK